MKKFLVLYLAPLSVLEDWAQTDPETRKSAEAKMMSDWRAWMGEHSGVFTDVGAGVGKTKVVTKDGVADTKNDIMLYCIVQAESHEAAAKIFEGHPHLGIPQATIQIMELHALTGMQP